MENVDIYLSPELYARNKSFLLSFTGTGEVNVTSTMLNRFRRNLNDQNYSVSKNYGFKKESPTPMLRNLSDQNFSVSITSQKVMKKDDFVSPDFKIDIKIKKPTTTSEIFKKTLEFSYSILEEKTKIKEMAPENMVELQGQSGYIKKLSEKVNLKSLTHAYEKFFLYDLDNVIKPTFTTELQKEFSIYSLISFSGKTKENNNLDLINPKNKLKFEMIKDIYKNNMKFELSKVHSKKKFNVIGNHVLNFAILQTKKQKRIGEKRLMAGQIIDTIPILGIQNTDYNFLNPIYISINSDVIIQKSTKYKNYRYRFVLESILFSSNIENETDVIFVICNGLNNAKHALINKKLENILGVCYLTEIKDWEIIKGQSKRSQAAFTDSEDIGGRTSHIAIAFTTKNISDLLNFSVTLLAGEGQNIKFPSLGKKIPIINFKIQIVN